MVVLLLATLAAPRTGSAGQLAKFENRSGEELYQAGCVACHGADGTGVPRSVVGFETPIPDFTDCSFATPEPDTDWMAVIHDGGPARGFDRRMPAYGQTLPRAALQRVLDYVRGFCTNPAWPRGELNLPRALVTEKAYPENEAVVTVGTSDGHVSTEFLYEQRLGARSQFEVAVPFSVQRGDARSWDRGLGDVAVAVKHALFHSRQAGTIFSAAGEVVLPTGKEDRGFGKGVTVFEPFVALGQILPADSFVQVQSGFELSTNRDRAGHEAFFRTALGKTFTEPRFGRAWSPMVEFLAGRELSDGESTAWDIVPQLQVSLSQRQHILLNAGVRVPLTSRGERDVQVLAYFLWDWFDGGLLEGW